MALGHIIEYHACLFNYFSWLDFTYSIPRNFHNQHRLIHLRRISIHPLSLPLFQQTIFIHIDCHKQDRGTISRRIQTHISMRSLNLWSIFCNICPTLARPISTAKATPARVAGVKLKENCICIGSGIKTFVKSQVPVCEMDTTSDS